MGCPRAGDRLRPIDIDKLARFGELIRPGGEELIEKLRRVRAGERFRL
jgi:hypothetical protein